MRKKFFKNLLTLHFRFVLLQNILMKKMKGKLSQSAVFLSKRSENYLHGSKFFCDFLDQFLERQVPIMIFLKTAFVIRVRLARLQLDKVSPKLCILKNFISF